MENPYKGREMAAQNESEPPLIVQDALAALLGSTSKLRDLGLAWNSLRGATVRLARVQWENVPSPRHWRDKCQRQVAHLLAGALEFSTTVRAARGRLGALRISHRKSVLCGGVLWPRGGLAAPL
jgi:hypothetical protein